MDGGSVDATKNSGQSEDATQHSNTAITLEVMPNHFQGKTDLFPIVSPPANIDR